MKCAAMRLGEEFHDVDDVRYLLRHLNITRVEEALAIVTQYFDESQFDAEAPPRAGGAPGSAVLKTDRIACLLIDVASSITRRRVWETTQTLRALPGQRPIGNPT